MPCPCAVVTNSGRHFEIVHSTPQPKLELCRGAGLENTGITLPAQEVNYIITRRIKTTECSLFKNVHLVRRSQSITEITAVEDCVYSPRIWYCGCAFLCAPDWGGMILITLRCSDSLSQSRSFHVMWCDEMKWAVLLTECQLFWTRCITLFLLSCFLFSSVFVLC